MICSGPEYKFIQTIIAYISNKLNDRQLNVAKYPIEVNFHAKITELHLHIKVNDVRMEGIHALGGIGETTIAKAVCNRIVEHSKTNDGIIKLQEKSLSDRFRGKNLKVESVAHETNMIKEMLPSLSSQSMSRQRVLAHGTNTVPSPLSQRFLPMEPIR